jgi:hypothetical protein
MCRISSSNLVARAIISDLKSYPEGIPAISRILSEAIFPEIDCSTTIYPEGIKDEHIRRPPLSFRFLNQKPIASNQTPMAKSNT